MVTATRTGFLCCGVHQVCPPRPSALRRGRRTVENQAWGHSLRRRHRQTEAVCAIDIRRGIIAPISHAAAHGAIAPAAAPVTFGIAGRRTLRIDLVSCCVGPTPVMHPFPDIPMHIVQPPGVRLELPYRMGGALVVLVIPGILLQQRIVIAKTVFARGPGPRRIFPLGFRGSRYRVCPSRALSLLMNSCAIFHDTRSTGRLGSPLK